MAGVWAGTVRGTFTKVQLPQGGVHTGTQTGIHQLPTWIQVSIGFPDTRNITANGPTEPMKMENGCAAVGIMAGMEGD